MITIYKNKKDIPQGMEYVELNDVFLTRIQQESLINALVI